MRGINITNDKKRDALVGFEVKAAKPSVTMTLPDGGERRNVRFVKTTVNEARFLSAFKSLEEAGEAIACGERELDIETTGCLIDKTSKLFLSPNGEIIYRLQRLKVVYDPQGNEKERVPFAALLSNVNTTLPLVWTGKEFPRGEAIKKFVFTRNYQIRHTSGLTYDFLYDMAKQLHERGTLMLIGAGKKGAEPLVLNLGGKPYRGFLEGRIDGEKYALILHLSDMELRSI
jgi:hypothetical protein